ncbi:MAG: hypothetical protein ABUK17_05795, partial [Syntrophobacteria bacterium]
HLPFAVVSSPYIQGCGGFLIAPWGCDRCSIFIGFADKDEQWSWSNGVVEHCKISNFKHQITNKSQIPIFNDQNSFGILKLGTRPQGGESKRSADNFGHCDLLFGIFSHFSTLTFQYSK